MHSIEYCPHCGANAFKMMSQKKFVCVECEFTYYVNVASAGAIILEYEDKIILTRRNREPSKGKLDLPGGFIDFNETIEEGLKREIKEELNLDVGKLNYLFSFPNKYLFKGVLYFTLDFFFTAKIKSLNDIIVDEENTEYVLLKPGEIKPSELSFDSIKKVISYYSKKNTI